MPWRIEKQGGKFCVVKIAGGAVVACHETRESAEAQREALYANTDYGLQLAIQELDLELARESDVNRLGGSHNLKNYWVRGPGAAEIGWGTDGSFARCTARLGKHVKNPQGLCAEYHKAATGEWPAEKGVESTVSGLEEFHGSHDQQDHNPHKGFHVPDISADDLAKLKSLQGKQPKYDVNSKTKPTSTRSFPSSEKIRGTKAVEDVDRAVELREGPYEPTRRQNIDRMVELERRADSDAGLNDSETRELRRLRRIYGDLYDPDYDDEYPRSDEDRIEDYSLTAAASGRRRKKDADSYSTGDGDEPWDGVLSVEGIESGDGRLFALGSLDWEQPPQPLMYQPANVGGHNASIMVGDIKQITRHGSRIRGKGTVFGSALRSEHGDGIRHMMETGGVSVDVDKVKDANVEMIYADAETGDGGGNMFAKPETTIFHAGRIRGATLVAFPAFVEAKLAFTGGTLTASATPACDCDISDPLIASVHTIEIPNLPKAEWFNEPTDVKVTGALTITDSGRVFGVVAPSDTTHRSVKARVPRNLDFSRFHKGETIVEGGGRVVTGVITASCGHAATQGYGTLNNRIDHYDNSCSVLANVRVGYSRNGSIWVAGALNPGAEPAQVAQALGCALSLDVQPHPDRPGVREFIAAHTVPVPGFPLARTQASVVYEDGVLAASSVPITHVATPTYLDGPRTDALFNVVMMTKNALALSVGLDPKTRKQQLMAELEAV